MRKISLFLVITVLSHIPFASCRTKPPNPHLRETPVHGRIQGGEAADAHEIPWLVRKVAGGYHACGGTILNEHYVLTAAHCVYMEPLDSILWISGDHNKRCFEGNEVIHTALHVKVHEAYVPVLTHNDLAIIKVTPSFKYSKYVRPAKLIGKNFIYPDQVLAVGWGRLYYLGESPGKLRKVWLDKQNDSLCNSTKLPTRYNASINICYRGNTKNESTCSGDSGSPVHCKSVVDGTLEVCAMVSWGYQCARSGRPSIFVRLVYFLDWIEQHSNISNPATSPDYANCGGYIYSSGTVIYEGFLFSNVQCHWVINSYYQVKTFKFLSYQLQPDDNVFFTDVTGKDICEGCTPMKFDHAKKDQTYTLNGTNALVIVSLRISSTQGNFRNVEFEFTSSGPIARLYPTSSLQYGAADKQVILYPTKLGTFYMPNDTMFVIINPLGSQFAFIQFAWTLMDIDDAGNNQTCPGDFLGFYRLGTRGTYSEYRRYCGRSRPNDIIEDMSGIVILKFQSTPNTAFGHGFGFNYTILQTPPGR